MPFVSAPVPAETSIASAEWVTGRAWNIGGGSHPRQCAGSRPRQSLACGLMVEIHVERTIAASVEQVFDWLADPAALTAAPLALRARWAKGSTGPGVGAVRIVTAAGTSFVRRSPRSTGRTVTPTSSFGRFPRSSTTAARWVTPSGDGTHVDWLTNYTHPAYAGGKLMEKISRPMLRSSFLAILAGCAKALEK